MNDWDSSEERYENLAMGLLLAAELDPDDLVEEIRSGGHDGLPEVFAAWYWKGIRHLPWNGPDVEETLVWRSLWKLAVEHAERFAQAAEAAGLPEAAQEALDKAFDEIVEGFDE